jgi:VanZ family protein
LRKFLLYWLPLILYVTGIFVLSSFPNIPRKLSLGLGDKLLHGIEYALLATLVARTLRSLSWPGRGWVIWLLTALAVLILGGIDEIYQSTIPSRNSDFMDLLADVAGGLTGGGLYLLVSGWSRRRALRRNDPDPGILSH